MIGNVGDAGGRHTPTVVVLMSHDRREWHRHRDAITLGGMHLAIATIEVVGVDGINHLIMSKQGAAFATAAVGQHPSASSTSTTAIASTTAAESIVTTTPEQTAEPQPTEQPQATATFAVSIVIAGATLRTAVSAIPSRTMLRTDSVTGVMV